MALEITVLRVLSAERRSARRGPRRSMLKIKGSEIRQWLTELHDAGARALRARRTCRSAGAGRCADAAERPARRRAGAAAAGQYLNFRKTTIYGGSNEIQRNIIAKHDARALSRRDD